VVISSHTCRVRGALHHRCHRPDGEVQCLTKTYTIVGVSEDSIHQAVRNALTKAGQTLRNIDWFEVKNIRGVLLSGRVTFHAELKIGFR
jgi:flavin-binding protein dodecin